MDFLYIYYFFCTVLQYDKIWTFTHFPVITYLINLTLHSAILRKLSQSCMIFILLWWETSLLLLLLLVIMRRVTQKDNIRRKHNDSTSLLSCFGALKGNIDGDIDGVKHIVIHSPQQVQWDTEPIVIRCWVNEEIWKLCDIGIIITLILSRKYCFSVREAANFDSHLHSLLIFSVTGSCVSLHSMRAPQSFGRVLQQNKLWDDIMAQRRLEKQSAEMLHTNGSQPRYKSLNALLQAKCQGNKKQFSAEIATSSAAATQVSNAPAFICI